MYQIGLINKEKLDELMPVFINAYPGSALSPEQYRTRTHFRNEYDFIDFYGAYLNEKPVGGMRIHSFTMNLLQEMVLAGGVGSVAVDLLHKKERVAFEMISFFLHKTRSEGRPIAMLYPFNPEFYKKMGFGFGIDINQFCIEPMDLPKGNSKRNIVELTAFDATALCEFYNRMTKMKSGLCLKCEREFESLFSENNFKLFGYKQGGEIQGYVVFSFKKGETGSFLVNDIVVSELLFENDNAFLELMTFLHSQGDQIRYVVLNTHDENFKFCLGNPVNHSDRLLTGVYHECSKRGMGMMYRITDVAKLFADLKFHNFNGVSCVLSLTIKDNLIEENDREFLIEFDNGYVTMGGKKAVEVELEMDISNFSSLITCSVDLKSLCRYGEAKISDDSFLNKLNNLFSSDEKPICLTSF